MSSNVQHSEPSLTKIQGLGILVMLGTCILPALQLAGFNPGLIPWTLDTALASATVGGALGGALICSRPMLAGCVGGMIAGPSGLLVLYFYARQRQVIGNYEFVLIFFLGCIPGFLIGWLIKRAVQEEATAESPGDSWETVERVSDPRSDDTESDQSKRMTIVPDFESTAIEPEAAAPALAVDPMELLHRGQLLRICAKCGDAMPMYLCENMTIHILIPAGQRRYFRCLGCGEQIKLRSAWRLLLLGLGTGMFMTVCLVLFPFHDWRFLLIVAVFAMFPLSLIIEFIRRWKYPPVTRWYLLSRRKAATATSVEDSGPLTSAANEGP